MGRRGDDPTSFNTSKVRFRDLRPWASVKKQGAFNTSKVRFRGALQQAFRTVPYVAFQYLKGAIQSRALVLAARSPGALSIPQRCDSESFRRETMRVRKESFNTSKVRFRAGWMSVPCDACAAFNTSKVRFRASRSSPRAAVMASFQYLKGAIQRMADRTLTLHMQIDFQYLKGAIQRDTPAPKPVGATCFQYLKGAIQRLNFPAPENGSRRFQYLKGAIQSSHRLRRPA